MLTESYQNGIYQAALNAYGQIERAAIEEMNCLTKKYSPAFLLRPRLFIDGDQWCALYGDNLQDGVAGFGASPELAFLSFDTAFYATLQKIK